jgi:hypothetical protein
MSVSLPRPSPPFNRATRPEYGRRLQLNGGQGSHRVYRMVPPERWSAFRAGMLQRIDDEPSNALNRIEVLTQIQNWPTK